MVKLLVNYLLDWFLLLNLGNGSLSFGKNTGIIHFTRCNDNKKVYICNMHDHNESGEDFEYHNKCFFKLINILLQLLFIK